MKSKPAASPVWEAFDEAIESSIAGSPTYPNGSTFVNADDPALGKAIKHAASQGGPIVIAYADGSTLTLRSETAKT